MPRGVAPKKGGVSKRTHHCDECNTDMEPRKKASHEKTALHKAMAAGGDEYDRCPQCEDNILKGSAGQSRLAIHMTHCREKEFYIAEGPYLVCQDLLDLLRTGVTEEMAVEARKEREALRDASPNDEPSGAKQVERSGAEEGPSSHTLEEQLLAFNPREMEHEELVTRVEELQQSAREPKSASKRVSPTAKSPKKKNAAYLLFKKGKNALIKPYIGRSSCIEARMSQHGLERNEIDYVKLDLRSDFEQQRAEFTLWSLFGQTRNKIAPPQKILYEPSGPGRYVKESCKRLRHLLAIELLWELKKKGFEYRL